METYPLPLALHFPPDGVAGADDEETGYNPYLRGAPKRH